MTFSFQARAFYERNGFEVVATLEDPPRGHWNHLMRKRLEPIRRNAASHVLHAYTARREV